MYFTKKLSDSADLASVSVVYFKGGFFFGPGPLYVPSSAEIEAATAEYKGLILRAPELINPGLDTALSSPEVARAALLADIDEKAGEFEKMLNKAMYFKSSLGFLCNGDRRTKDNLRDLVSFGPAEGVQYRDYNNELHILTRQQLQTLLVEHITNGQNLYNQKWALQSLVNSAQGFDGLHGIEIKFTMMDFSNGV